MKKIIDELIIYMFVFGIPLLFAWEIIGKGIVESLLIMWGIR